SAVPFAVSKQDDWDACANEYVRRSMKLGFYEGITMRLQAMVPSETSRILDFGCGNGRLTRTLLRSSVGLKSLKTAFLLDKFTEMLDMTADLEKLFPQIEFVRIQDSEALAKATEVVGEPVDVIAC